MTHRQTDDLQRMSELKIILQVQPNRQNDAGLGFVFEVLRAICLIVTFCMSLMLLLFGYFLLRPSLEGCFQTIKGFLAVGIFLVPVFAALNALNARLDKQEKGREDP